MFILWGQHHKPLLVLSKLISILNKSNSENGKPEESRLRLTPETDLWVRIRSGSNRDRKEEREGQERRKSVTRIGECTVTHIKHGFI